MFTLVYDGDGSETEGSTITLTVKLDQPANETIVISLSASPPDAASLPSSITIPANQTSASFSVSGTRSGDIAITATSSGESSIVGFEIESAAWINEIHYDNAGIDVGEFIEIAGVAGTDLSDYAIYLVNGAGAVSYDRIDLAGSVLPAQQRGFGTVAFALPENGLQNGSPDGIALVNVRTNSVVQFLSYEGVIQDTKFSGFAGSYTSTDIGVSEPGNTSGESLQLVGVGTSYSDFSWGVQQPQTAGGANQGQTFDRAPTGADDHGYISSGTKAQIATSLLLVNDSDSEGDPIAITGVSGSINGAAGLSDGRVSFAATAGSVVASFDYDLTDGVLAGGAQVTLEVVGTSEGADSIIVATRSGEFSYIAGLGGDDTLIGGSGSDTFLGGVGDDELTGQADADHLNGGRGEDRLVGGTGDDTYMVDVVGDVVLEQSDEGYDTVQASVSFRLAHHLERLLLTGSQDIVGTGNTADNRIMGNGGSNVLNGGAGVDTLSGGLGDDVYVVDNALDQILEGTDAGVDTVRIAVSYKLRAGQDIEKVVMIGSADLKATGNELDNSLLGNGADNFLEGGAGNDLLGGGLGRDVLTGGLDADTFVFRTVGDSTVESPSRDVIRDFSQVQGDMISLRAIDAIAGGSDQAFTFIGSNAFSQRAGELQAILSGGNTLVRADIDGNGRTDFAFLLHGNHTLQADDFVL